MNCKNIESIPDISQWKTDKVIYMYNLFYGCEKLKKPIMIFQIGIYPILLILVLCLVDVNY